MNRDNDPLQAVLDDVLLDLDAFCRASAVPPQWLVDRVQDGLLPVHGRLAPPEDSPAGWRFDVQAVRRVRWMLRVEQDFGAGPELAALVADLQGEIERLRTRLGRPDRH